MIIVVDFDGVLLDDKRFKEEKLRLFRKLGVSTRLYREAYEAVKKKKGGAYDFHTHLKEIKKRYVAFSISAAERVTDRFIRISHRFVYRDAVAFLAFWRKRNVPLILLSTGPAFQKEKVRRSGLARFFKRIIVIRNAEKHGSLGRVMRQFPKRDVVFIDDKKSVVDGVKTYLPTVFTIQMKRRASQERSKRGDAITRNLAHARRIILSWQKKNQKS